MENSMEVPYTGFPGSSSGKEPACQCRRHKRHGFNPWVRKVPWNRAWHPTPVFLPGESHGRRSLGGYSPRGRKESDTTEQLHFHFSWLPLLNLGTGIPSAAAMSLQSCPTLCDPRDSSPPGSPVPGILQVRTMEWVAISFSNA